MGECTSYIWMRPTDNPGNAVLVVLDDPLIPEEFAIANTTGWDGDLVPGANPTRPQDGLICKLIMQPAVVASSMIPLVGMDKPTVGLLLGGNRSPTGGPADIAVASVQS